MKKYLLLLWAIVLLAACNSDDDVALSDENFLVFGHFYGECFGEECVETFKLTNTQLLEDTLDSYTAAELNFEPLPQAKFEQVKNLIDLFPNRLRNDETEVFGCPDCADAGGLFIQYAKNGKLKSWRIDQVQRNVPAYLHRFMDEVNEKIRLINN